MPVFGRGSSACRTGPGGAIRHGCPPGAERRWSASAAPLPNCLNMGTTICPARGARIAAPVENGEGVNVSGAQHSAGGCRSTRSRITCDWSASSACTRTSACPEPMASVREEAGHRRQQSGCAAYRRRRDAQRREQRRERNRRARRACRLARRAAAPLVLTS